MRSSGQSRRIAGGVRRALPPPGHPSVVGEDQEPSTRSTQSTRSKLGQKPSTRGTRSTRRRRGILLKRRLWVTPQVIPHPSVTRDTAHAETARRSAERAFVPGKPSTGSICLLRVLRVLPCPKLLLLPLFVCSVCFVFQASAPSFPPLALPYSGTYTSPWRRNSAAFCAMPSSRASPSPSPCSRA